MALVFCKFAGGPRHFICERCEFEVNSKHDFEPHQIRAVCKASRGIGDSLAGLFARFGFKKKCAPCARRQAKLNRFGWYIRHRLTYLRRLISKQQPAPTASNSHEAGSGTATVICTDKLAAPPPIAETSKV